MTPKPSELTKQLWWRWYYGRAHHAHHMVHHAPWLWLSPPYGHPPALALALPTIWPKPWLKGPVSKNPTIQFHKFLSRDSRNAAPIQIILSLRHPNSHGAADPQHVPTLTYLLFQASAAGAEQEMTIWRWTDVRGGGGKKRTASYNWKREGFSLKPGDKCPTCGLQWMLQYLIH